MSDTVETLILDLVAWVERSERTTTKRSMRGARHVRGFSFAKTRVNAGLSIGLSSMGI